MKIVCGPDYPFKAPIIRFINKIHLDCVNPANGMVLLFIILKIINYKVENMKLEFLKNWSIECTLEKVLVALREEMLSAKNRKTLQPAEGASYF